MVMQQQAVFESAKEGVSFDECSPTLPIDQIIGLTDLERRFLTKARQQDGTPDAEEDTDNNLAYSRKRIEAGYQIVGNHFNILDNNAELLDGDDGIRDGQFGYDKRCLCAAWAVMGKLIALGEFRITLASKKHEEEMERLSSAVLFVADVLREEFM